MFLMVKYFDWNMAKNETLIVERGVSFEDIIVVIFEGNVLTSFDHPNQKKYPGQKVYVVELHGYAYVVPYVEDGEKILLKTIFPSRRYTEIYLEEEKS